MAGTLMVCRNCGAGVVYAAHTDEWLHLAEPSMSPPCPLLEPMYRELHEGMVRNIEAYLTREKK